MKSLKLLMFTFLILLMMAPVALAADKCASDCGGCDETEIKVYGSFRYRLMLEEENPFHEDTNMDMTQYTRTRLGVKASRGNAGMNFEVQDSRILGDQSGTLDFTNGGMHTEPFYYGPYDKTIASPGYRNDFGVRQAYMWYKPCDKGGLKVGRFGLNLHNQRLVGEVGWHNVGRTLEGLMFKRELTEGINLIGAALQVEEWNENDADGENVLDHMFYVVDLNLVEQNVDLFMYYWAHDGVNVDTMSEKYKLMTFGAYSKREFGSNMFYDAMFAIQSGSQDALATPAKASGAMDFSGMLINAEVGTKLENGMKISALLDYTTGDDPETTDEVETFNNLLYTGHKWNGYMDYFLGGIDNGLMDIALRLGYPVNETTWIKGDFHMFSTVEEYADGKSSLGNEIDLTLVKKHGDAKFMAGFSIFMPSDDYMTDAETSKWAYLQTAFGF